jgi:hypothetical protein
MADRGQVKRGQWAFYLVGPTLDNTMPSVECAVLRVKEGVDVTKEPGFTDMIAELKALPEVKDVKWGLAVEDPQHLEMLVVCV